MVVYLMMTNLSREIGLIPLDFDRIVFTTFTHVFSVPILMIAMNYTKNISSLVLQILCVLTGTWMFIDNVNAIQSRTAYSKKDDLAVVILLGIIMIPEVGTMAMFGSINAIMTIVVMNLLLVILNAMIDSRRDHLLQFWYEMSSCKSFLVSIISMYLVIQNPGGNLPMAGGGGGV